MTHFTRTLVLGGGGSLFFIFGTLLFGWPLFCLFIVLLMTVSVMAVGSLFIGLNFYLFSVNGFIPEGKQIAITFDDGPDKNTEKVLDILKKNGAKATFFLIGKNIKGREKIVKRIYDEGHCAGIHSYYHKKGFPLQPVKAMIGEIEECSISVEQVTGIKPVLFRPPFGITNPRVAKAVKLTGVTSVGWSLRSLDTKTDDPGRLLGKLKRKSKSGQIVLLHDTRDVTVNVLEPYLLFLRQKGFETVTLKHVAVR